ncbi:MAG TPA: hypothetical protein VK772_14865 [Puia sp.]|nr:hypothetical protein [Puia sp.]
MRRFNKITAIFLILIFFQKAGLELYLHNWLHQNKNHFALSSTNAAICNIQIKCHCIDDALRPINTAINDFEIRTPEKKIFCFHDLYNFSLSHFSKIFHPLRGPPVTS